jgi:putative sigma-54 modulation protein
LARAEVKVRTIVKGKNFDVPEGVRRYAERKLHRIERIVEEPTDAIVELSVEQHRSAADSHLVDVSLIIDGRTIRGRAAALTHEAGIDEVVDKLERRANDHKARRVARGRTGELAAIERRLADGTAASEPSGRVVKVKSFDIEPMFEEDAIARMEELGHAFFVFVNAEGERVNVLYRRSAGDYGLIDPVIRTGSPGGRLRSARA